MSSFLQTLIDSLPDFAGILLAAVGVALVIWPEAVKKLEHREGLRKFLATLLVISGLIGLIVAHYARGKIEADQRAVADKIDSVKVAVEGVTPRIDKLNADQVHRAVTRDGPAVEIINIEIPSQNFLKATLVNTGNQPARDVTVRTSLIFFPFGDPVEERELFLEMAHQSPDTTSFDLRPGFDERRLVSKKLASLTPDELEDWARQPHRGYIAAPYYGIQVTYFDPNGKSHLTERCVYLSPIVHEATSCRTHNTEE